MANAPITLTVTNATKVTSTYTLCHPSKTGGYLLQPQEDRK